MKGQEPPFDTTRTPLPLAEAAAFRDYLARCGTPEEKAAHTGHDGRVEGSETEKPSGALYVVLKCSCGAELLVRCPPARWYQTPWWPRPPLFREARGQPLFEKPIVVKVKSGPRLILWRTLVPKAEPHEELWQLRTDNQSGKLTLHQVKRDDWELFESLDDPSPPA